MRTMITAAALLAGTIVFACVTLANPRGSASAGESWQPMHAIVTSLALDSPATCDSIPYSELLNRTERLVPRDLSGWYLQQVDSGLVTLTGYDTARGEMGRREVVIVFRKAPGAGETRVQNRPARVAWLTH